MRTRIVRCAALTASAICTVTVMTGCALFERRMEHNVKTEVSFSWWGKDAKKVYTQGTAAVLRAKDCVMKTTNVVQENAEDILAEAKQINEKRYEKENSVEEAEEAEEATEA